MQLIIFFIVCFLYVSESLAAPSVSTSNIVVMRGENVTISGSGFGVKSPASPMLWENFESGSNGTLLTSDSKWIKYESGNDSGYFSSSHQYSGSLSAYSRKLGANGTVDDFSTSNYVLSNPTDTIYYSYMYRYDVSNVNTDNTAQPKAGRANVGENRYNGPGNTNIDSSGNFDYGGNSPGVVMKNGAPDLSGIEDGTPSLLEGLQSETWNGTQWWDSSISGSVHAGWVRHEIAAKLSTPGVADGFVSFQIGNEIKRYRNIVTRESGQNYQYTNVILGLMAANPAETADIEISIDDVYVDNTQARVEIGNASTLDACTRKEIQIPTSWGSDSISFNVNQGKFTNSDDVYLFVVDSAGQASAGARVYFGTATRHRIRSIVNQGE